MCEEKLTREERKKARDEREIELNKQGLTGVRPENQFHTSINDPDFVSYGNDGLNRGNSNNRRS